MQISFDEMIKITSGAVRIIENEDGYRFYRYTQEQEKVFENKIDNTFSTSGIRMEFYTDSEYIFLEAEIMKSTSRTYFAFDIMCNDRLLGYLGNIDLLGNQQAKTQLPIGEYQKKFTLGKGKKKVRIEFPWSVASVIKKIELSDGSYIIPIKRKYKMIAYGDSITHGFDALHPTNKYITKLSDELDAEEFNKAMGGDTFNPQLAAASDNFTADYVVIAYGTNDFTSKNRKQFFEDADRFMKIINDNYQNAKIFVITPIWRRDYETVYNFGDFFLIKKNLITISKKYDNFHVIDGFCLIPHKTEYYKDSYLHPNDEGFQKYFDSLRYIIKTELYC